MLGKTATLAGGLFALMHVARMRSRVQDVDGEQMKPPGIVWAYWGVRAD